MPPVPGPMTDAHPLGRVTCCDTCRRGEVSKVMPLKRATACRVPPAVASADCTTDTARRAGYLSPDPTPWRGAGRARANGRQSPARRRRRGRQRARRRLRVAERGTSRATCPTRRPSRRRPPALSQRRAATGAGVARSHEQAAAVPASSAGTRADPPAYSAATLADRATRTIPRRDDAAKRRPDRRTAHTGSAGPGSDAPASARDGDGRRAPDRAGVDRPKPPTPGTAHHPGAARYSAGELWPRRYRPRWHAVYGLLADRWPEPPLITALPTTRRCPLRFGSRGPPSPPEAGVVGQRRVVRSAGEGTPRSVPRRPDAAREASIALP